MCLKEHFMENYEKRYCLIKANGALNIKPDIKIQWFPSSLVYKACGLQKASRKKIRASTVYRCKEARMLLQNTSIYLAKETILCLEQNNLQKGIINLHANPPSFTAKGVMKALGFPTRQAFYKSREYKNYLLRKGRYFIVTKPLGKNKLAMSIYEANAVYELQKAYIRYYAYRIRTSKRDAYMFENYFNDTNDAVCPTCGMWGVKLDETHDASGNILVLCPNCGINDNKLEVILSDISWAFSQTLSKLDTDKPRTPIF
jgi:hypothetical protein